MRLKSESNEANERSTLDCLVAIYEKSLIRDALKQTDGNATHAAAILGTTQRIMNYKIHKYKIDVREFYIYQGRRKNRKKNGTKYSEENGGRDVR